MISGFDLTRQGSNVNFQMMSPVPVYLVNIDRALPSTLHLPRNLPTRIFFGTTPTDRRLVSPETLAMAPRFKLLLGTPPLRP